MVVVGARWRREAAGLRLQGRHKARMGMAVAYGRIGAHHIDVAAPGCVPHVSALTAREHDGKRFIIVSAVPALKFHCVHGHNSNRLDRLYLGIGGDRSRRTTGITPRTLHLDGLVAAQTAEPRVCGRVGKGDWSY